MNIWKWTIVYTHKENNEFILLLQVYDQDKRLTTPLDNKEGLYPRQLEEYHPHEIVIDRVLQLVSRLETDRSEMEKLLEQERNRTRSLHEKIDWHAYRRIQELPKAVQKGQY